MKKEAKTFILLCVVFVGAPTPSCADEEGRDFPKTLIFDEPGIDDEISLPTIVVTPQHGGNETDADFELDKRLATRLSLQINIGYTQLPRPDHAHAEGWQNANATLKFVVYSDKDNEQLVSLSLIREFGRSGAQQIDAAPVSATTAAFNFGQGFAALTTASALQPFALTGSVGFLVPDQERAEAVQQALLSASLQYSLDVLSNTPAGSALPRLLRPFIPIVECSLASPTHGGRQRGLVTPGLIYSGKGYQLAAEALLPLTKEAGTHAGFIAQLNISLETLAVPALARPLL